MRGAGAEGIPEGGLCRQGMFLQGFCLKEDIFGSGMLSAGGSTQKHFFEAFGEELFRRGIFPEGHFSERDLCRRETFRRGVFVWERDLFRCFFLKGDCFRKKNCQGFLCGAFFSDGDCLTWGLCSEESFRRRIF